jgi:hypothetical protein
VCPELTIVFIPVIPALGLPHIGVDHFLTITFEANYFKARYGLNQPFEVGQVIVGHVTYDRRVGMLQLMHTSLEMHFAERPG